MGTNMLFVWKRKQQFQIDIDIERDFEIDNDIEREYRLQKYVCFNHVLSAACSTICMDISIYGNGNMGLIHIDISKEYIKAS